jgi:hypothetical protein
MLGKLFGLFRKKETNLPVYKIDDRLYYKDAKKQEFRAIDGGEKISYHNAVQDLKTGKIRAIKSLEAIV